MEKLDKNVFIALALDLSLSDLSALCQAKKRFNDLLCNNNEFWRLKLFKEYPYTIGLFKKKEDFQIIYRKTKDAIYTLPLFNEIGENLEIDWKKRLKSLYFSIIYLYRIDFFEFYLRGEFDDEELNDGFDEQLTDENYEAGDRLYRSYKLNSEEREEREEREESNAESDQDEESEDKIENKIAEDEFPDIDGIDIERLFEPALLRTLKNNKIPFVEIQYYRKFRFGESKKIVNEIKLDEHTFQVDISSDT
jgi:hypothetical protein